MLCYYFSVLQNHQCGFLFIWYQLLQVLCVWLIVALWSPLKQSLDFHMSISLLFCSDKTISISCSLDILSLLNPTASYSLPYFSFVPAMTCMLCRSTQLFIFSLHFLLPSRDCILFSSHAEEPNATLLPVPPTLSRRHSVSAKYPMRANHHSFSAFWHGMASFQSCSWRRICYVIEKPSLCLLLVVAL
jgi:hypothetical protein